MHQLPVHQQNVLCNALSGWEPDRASEDSGLCDQLPPHLDISDNWKDFPHPAPSSLRNIGSISMKTQWMSDSGFRSLCL